MKIPHGSDDYTVSNVEVTPYYTDIKFKMYHYMMRLEK